METNTRPTPGSIPIKALQAERYVITIKKDGVVRKIFQIGFGPDGTIYVHFPYHKDSHGIASIVTLDANISYPTNNVSLVKEGKVTSHKIKFSHHPSGQVHFSQTGKIFTRVKRRGTSTRDIDGHIFTVMLQELSWFEEAKKEKDRHHRSTDRTVVEFDVTGLPDGAYKFIALWNTLPSLINSIQKPIPQEGAGPKIIHQLGPAPRAGFLLNPLPDNPMREHVLSLVVEPIPIFEKDQTHGIIFIGGFDPLELVNDKTKPTSFLALVYPAKNPEELIKKVGTIDLRDTMSPKETDFS